MRRAVRRAVRRAALVVVTAVAAASLMATTSPGPEATAGRTTTTGPGPEAAASSTTAALDVERTSAPHVGRSSPAVRASSDTGPSGHPAHVAASPRPVHVDLTPHGRRQRDEQRRERDEQRREREEQRQQHHEGPVSPEGFQVAGGSSRGGDGPTIAFTVELDDAVGADISEVVEIVEVALYDARSWAHDHTLERVDDPGAADIRIVLAPPATVDALCAEAGLRTGGIYSCWNGRFAALNSLRWTEGASGFGDDLEAYRTYLVNHEFGHGLGYGHVGCPAAGGLAPVMMQQSKGTDGCEPNGWPHPEVGALPDD